MLDDGFVGVTGTRCWGSATPHHQPMLDDGFIGVTGSRCWGDRQPPL